MPRYYGIENIEWAPFSQIDIYKSAEEIGVPLDPKGVCYAICALFVAQTLRHPGDIAREDYMTKINGKLSKNFLERVTLAQTQTQSQIQAQSYQITVDDIKNTQPLLNILPQELENSEHLSFNLHKHGGGHATVIQILRKEDGEVRYKFFDPNLGLTEELTDKMLKATLQWVVGTFYENEYATFTLSDIKPDITQLLKHGRQKYPEAKYLHLATSSVKVMEYLLKLGADVNTKIEGRTALHEAAIDGKTEAANFLIANGADINARTENGNTPLHNAVLNGQAEIIKLFIKEGADINAKTGDGKTLLHEAVDEEKGKAIELLIKNGADVNARAKNGNTPLYNAVLKDNSEAIKLLIENGADVNTKNEFGESPLLKAALKGSTETIELLIKNGADVNVKERSGNTPLLNAASRGHTETIELLIENGADINIKDRIGRTPLHLAAARGEIKNIELLLKNGGDIHSKDNRNETALDKARKIAASEEVINTLTEAATSVNKQENTSYSTKFRDMVTLSKEDAKEGMRKL